MNKEKILEIIEEYQKEIDYEYKDLRAEAYTVRLQDNHAIELRDRFNKNAGKYEILANIKFKITEIKDKE